jgi:AraC-like DNA-binding protein
MRAAPNRATLRSMDTITDLAALIARHAPVDGSVETAIAGVGLVRASAATTPVHTMYEPSFCMVAQGRKRATLAGRAWQYDPAHFLIVGMDLPVIGAVLEASPERPYLSLRLQLKRTILAELLAAEPPPDDVEVAPMALGTATPALVDAAARLLRLLDAPEDVAVLAPLVEREITHRLLRGPQGALLRQIAHRTSRINRVQKAVDYIRRHFHEPFAIDDLAAVADMSVSSFHAHFKQATHLSPLRFRTQLRLQEARRLMLVEGLGAAEAGYRVGYESASHFSRDYGRVFAAPPRRDVAQLRGVEA